MNRIWIVVAMVLFLLAPIVKVSAQDELSSPEQKSWLRWKPYVSIGGDYGQKFNATNIAEEKRMNLNSFGYNVRTGIVSTYLAVEVEYTSLQNFEAKYTYTSGAIKNSRVGFSANALMLNVKAGYPLMIKKQPIKPYVIAGIGTATVDERMGFSIASTYINGTYNFEHKSSGNSCSKVGLGLEMPIYKDKLVIFSEISQWHLNKKGGVAYDGKGATAEFYDLKLSMITTVLNLKYLF